MILLLVGLDDLEAIAAGIGNAYLRGKTLENSYTEIDLGGEHLKRKYLIVEKSHTARWHEASADVLRKLVFILSKADSDMWIKDCSTNYEYLVVVMNYLIIVRKRPLELVKELKSLGGYTLNRW